MSTAFRYCGSVCSACSMGSYVPYAPGGFSAPREHYDLRAFEPLLWQLGSQFQLHGLKRHRQSFGKMWPKSNLKSKIAAFRSFVSSLNIFSPPRGEKLRHSPPLFPPCHPPP